jgi:integrase
VKRSKRPNGEGSIFFSDSQQTWVAEILLPNGKKKRKRNKLQKVVRGWLDKEKEAVRSGLWVADEKTLYSDFLDRYMNEIAGHTLRPKTLENYTYAIKNHIKPTLGKMRIVAIRPDHLQRLYSDLLDSGLSKSTVKYIHAIIRKTLGTAFKWGLVIRNVSEVVTPPPPEVQEIKPLTVDQVKQLLKVLENDRLYAFYVLISTSGIRKGEALGLQKSDLDLEAGSIVIRHSLAQIYGRGLVLGEPKSEKSRRELALPPFTVNVLKKHLEKYSLNSNFVFSTSKGTPFSPRNILRHFKAKLQEAGLPETTRVHDLRHSFISWLLASGTSIRDIQAIAGHAQASTTLAIYSHVLPGYNKEAAKKIEDMFVTEQ